MGQTERYNTNRHHLRPIKKIQAGDKMDALVFGDSGSMGSSLNGNGFIREQHERNKGFIYSIGRNIYRVIVKRTTAMAESKMILFFADLFGVPVFAFSAWLNFGDVKGYALLAIAFVYGCARVYFYIRKEKDLDTMRKLKIKEREHEIEEIIHENEE